MGSWWREKALTRDEGISVMEGIGSGPATGICREMVGNGTRSRGEKGQGQFVEMTGLEMVRNLGNGRTEGEIAVGREDERNGENRGFVEELETKMEVEGMAARWSRGGDGGGLRRRRLEDGVVALTVGKNPWPGQGVAAVVAAAARRRAAAAAVGLLPRPSLSSHLRGRALLSFFK